jgi:hypothetical protein
MTPSANRSGTPPGDRSYRDPSTGFRTVPGRMSQYRVPPERVLAARSRVTLEYKSKAITGFRIECMLKISTGFCSSICRRPVPSSARVCTGCPGPGSVSSASGRPILGSSTGPSCGPCTGLRNPFVRMSQYWVRSRFVRTCQYWVPQRVRPVSVRLPDGHHLGDLHHSAGSSPEKGGECVKTRT